MGTHVNKIDILSNSRATIALKVTPNIITVNRRAYIGTICAYVVHARAIQNASVIDCDGFKNIKSVF